MPLALACTLLLAAPAPAPPRSTTTTTATTTGAPKIADGKAGAGSAAAAFGATAKLRVVVMNTKLASVAADYGQAVDGILTESLDQMGPFRAVGERDIANMLDFEAEKQKLGCTDDVSCLSEVAGAFGADYVVSATLTNADGVYLLQLSLLDIAKASVIARERRTSDSKAAMLDVSATAVEALVRPLLEARSGSLSVRVSEEGATIKIDRRVVGTSPLAVLPLPAGVHSVDVEKVGFIVASRDVQVMQDETADVSFTLRPSEDYKKAYVQSATTMRIAAIATTSAGAVAALASAGAFWLASTQADALRPQIAKYNATGVRTSAAKAELDRQLSLIGAVDTTSLTLAIIGVAGVGAGCSLFLVGGDPGRYDAP